MTIEEFYKDNYRIVYGYLLSLCRNIDIAEDLALETFLKAIQKNDSYDGICKPSTWLCAIARDLYFNEFKRQKKYAKLDENDQIKNSDYKEALKTQKRRASRKIRVYALSTLIFGIAISIFILQAKGYLSVIERRTSPDGGVTSAVYDGTSGTFFLKKGDFTVQETGDVRNTTVYSGSFDGMWWSPDSRYLVISSRSDNGVFLSMTDYKKNELINLNACLNDAICNNPAFSEAIKNKSGKSDIE